MKFEDVISINEAITKADNSYVGGKSYTFITRNLMGYLHNKNVIIDLDFTKADSISYLAKVSGHEELLDLIHTATMDKDFQERNKAQKLLRTKMSPCFQWLKENIYDIASKRNKPKISQNSRGEYIVEYDSGINEPYIKFIDTVDHVWKLKSFHDNSMVLKKKSYNDNRSYKFGSSETKKMIKARAELEAQFARK